MTLNYPKTGSTILGPSGQNKTSTGISTNIIIKVGGNTVGAVQKLTITETRNVSPITELGTDGVIDSVPTKSTEISGNCGRVRFDRMRIAEAFGRDFIHVQSQRRPFDIEIIDQWGGEGSQSVITTIKNVWIKSISYTYSSDNWIVSDEMSWMAETIYSYLGSSGKSPVTGGGERANGFKVYFDEIEQQADTGARRGSLDAPGLIKIFG